MSKDCYTLRLGKRSKTLKLAIWAQDCGHAQAQAADIARAFGANLYDLLYEPSKDTVVSDLFKDLADNSFHHSVCTLWAGSVCNGTPCCYALQERHYIRNVILRYLDIPKEDSCARPSCGNKTCINPYHFKYSSSKNEKISSGDRRLLVAYRSRGAGITQIAKVLNVHRSTIYRNLKHESVFAGAKDHCYCAGR